MNIYKIRYGYEENRYTSDDKYIYYEVDDDFLTQMKMKKQDK